MAGIDEVLERLVIDPGFRQQLRSDPRGALDGYRLTDADLELLASQFDDRTGAHHGVEERTSKSAFLSAMSGFAEYGDGEGGQGSAAEWESEK